MMKRRHSSRPALPLLLLAAAACSAGAPQVERSDAAAQSTAAASGAPAAQGRVLPGLEVLLRDSIHLVRGKRVGFITNQSAVSSTGESGIDLLHRAPGVQLVALYAVEHGLRGAVEGGVKIDASRDEKTGVPIHSLYGATQKPTPAMLQGVDVLLFDIQDIGARPYTFGRRSSGGGRSTGRASMLTSTTPPRMRADSSCTLEVSGSCTGSDQRGVRLR